MEKLGTYSHYVEIDAEDVLDEVSTEDLVKYLAERRYVKVKRFTDDGARDTIIALCLGKVRRNMEDNKEEVKAAIIEIIDELF